MDNTKCRQKSGAKETDNTAESINWDNCYRDKFIILNQVEYVNNIQGTQQFYSYTLIPKESLTFVHKETHKRMLITALFVIQKIGDKINVNGERRPIHCA